MPELFIVGTQRSGTTYLYQMLSAHPQVYMSGPVRPEPKYFLDIAKVKKGKAFYEAKYFPERLKTHTYIGEKSTSYIEDSSVAERIKSFYPDARILIILRDPVERAYSNYRFSVQHEIENLSFAQALATESERLSFAEFSTSVNPYAYQQRGHYINYLENYSGVFERSQIKVLIHEEFIANPEAIGDLYSWLGIERTFLPVEYNMKVNSARDLQSDGPEIQQCKQDLYTVFERSNRQLERYLGRKVESWGPK